MGFVLQLSGIFLLLPIIASFILIETDATVALFISATSFLALGFVTNALCERREMTYKQSCTLIVSVFIILSLIGSIPYIYLSLPAATGNVFQVITDGIFESVSGFTTTGFSVIPDLSALPQSIILYRSLTQFIGGIGVVVVLLAFFYPEAKLKEFAKSVGLSQENHKVKRTFLFIVSLYCAFTIIMVVAGYISGYHDLISLSSVIFSALSTGGFSLPTEMATFISQPPFNFIIPLSMILGATNLIIFAKLAKGKIKEFFNDEIIIFLIMAVLATALVVRFFGVGSYDAFFHIISAMSTTGFSYVPLQSLDSSFKLLLISLMFIGGASFSTAGGIKIYRFLLMLKSVRKSVVYTVVGKDNKIKLLGREFANADVIQSAVLIFLMGLTIFGSSLIVSYYGFTPLDSVFECTSALATTGLSMGIVGPSLALELKWMFMFLMLLGRVEIISFLVIFVRSKEQHLIAPLSADEPAVVPVLSDES
jgi:trk system potassium uptake protein TrkH